MTKVNRLQKPQLIGQLLQVAASNAEPLMKFVFDLLPNLQGFEFTNLHA